METGRSDSMTLQFDRVFAVSGRWLPSTRRWLTLVNHGTVFYMNEVTTVLLEEAEVRNLNDQVAHLEPGEPYLTVIVDGKAIVRATRGISQTLLQLWRSEPAMMVPDSLGYRPATRQVDLADL
jgi:hypothetical protein